MYTTITTVVVINQSIIPTVL